MGWDGMGWDGLWCGVVDGELWRVSPSTLEGLDQYEGVDKAYYGRVMMRVSITTDGASSLSQPPETTEAQVYGILSSPSALRQLPFLQENTAEIHRQTYNAVAHIGLNPSRYLRR